MPALLADTDRTVTGTQLSARLSLLASAICFTGSLLSYDATGFANRLVAGQPFAGVAMQRIELGDWPAAGAANGDRFVTAAHGFGFLQATIAGAAQVDVQRQRKVYASDDNTFTFSAAGNTYIGEVAAFLGGTTVLIFWTTVEQRDEVPGALGVVTYADGAVTVLANDLNKVIHAPITVARTYTLPPVAQAIGHYYTFINTGGAFALTIAANGAEKIKGAANLAQAAALGSFTTIYGTGVANAEWAVISNG